MHTVPVVLVVVVVVVLLSQEQYEQKNSTCLSRNKRAHKGCPQLLEQNGAHSFPAGTSSTVSPAKLVTSKLGRPIRFQAKIPLDKIRLC
jgi:hypothetical protein